MQILHVSMQQVMSTGSLPIKQMNKQIESTCFSRCLKTMLSRAVLKGWISDWDDLFSVPLFLGTEAGPQKHIPDWSQPSHAAIYQRMFWPISSQELVEKSMISQSNSSPLSSFRAMWV